MSHNRCTLATSYQRRYNYVLASLTWEKALRMRIKFEWGTHPPMDEVGAHVARQGMDLRFYGLMIGKYALGMLIYSKRKKIDKTLIA